MGKKIKVVDIPKEETNLEVEQPAPENNEVIPDIEPQQETTVEPVIQEETVIPPKKAKTKSKSKKKDVDVTPSEVPELQTEAVPVVEAVTKIEEVPTLVSEEKVESKEKVKKVIEQVKCPKCDKMMSQKSLRYTHEQNCKGKVVKTEDLPVKRRTDKKVQPTKVSQKEEVQTTTNKKDIYEQVVAKNVSLNTSEVEIPEELKNEVLKTIQRQQARLKMREENLNRLKMQIV